MLLIARRRALACETPNISPSPRIIIPRRCVFLFFNPGDIDLITQIPNCFNFSLIFIFITPKFLDRLATWIHSPKIRYVQFALPNGGEAYLSRPENTIAFYLSGRICMLRYFN